MAEKQPQPQAFDEQHMYVWVKGLETKLNTLLRETEVLKNDLLRRNREVREQTKVLSDTVLETKRSHEQLLQRVSLLVKELERTATQEDVATLKKYVDLWNPLYFVTQKDVERILARMLEEREQRRNI